MIFAADARQAAREWVATTASQLPGYRGAFLAGSAAELVDDALLPPWSDADVMVVRELDEPIKGGKFEWNGVLLEATSLAAAEIADLEAALGNYHLANALAQGIVLDDPEGWLGPVLAEAARRFPERRWVEARAAAARESVARGLAAIDPGAPLAVLAQSWVFPTGIMTHVLLVAGLRNPTVRRRYEAVRELLADDGRLDLHERLLEMLGCAAMTPAQARRLLETVTALYDTAALVDGGGYRFASDVSEVARPISIDGTRDMIDRGYHREAAFWLVVTASRALQKLASGAGADFAAAHEPALREVLAELGIASRDDIARRRDEALTLLPEVWDAGRAIMDETPGVVP